MDDEKEEKQSTARSKIGGWLKGIIGAVAGLLSGAVMMYVSPLIDKVIKPPKPIANFAVEHEGTTVTFHNRSSGSNSGWWDFGDGSQLEEVTPSQEVVTHTYANPGDYTAKLKVQNLLGDENERVVNLHLDTAHTEPPSIVSLEVTPVSGASYAPATFRVRSKVKNAQVCIWELDDGRPLELVDDMASNGDRLVTFNRPGGYIIKLAAVSGKQAVEKSEVVNVLDPPAGSVSAILTVSEQATRVETVNVPYVFFEPFPAGHQGDSWRFNRQAMARPGFQIKDAIVQLDKGQGPHLQNQADMSIDPKMVQGATARDLHLQMAADRRSVHLSGEMLKPSGAGKKGPMPNLQLPVVLVEERRTTAQRPGTTVTATLVAPGSAMLMMPPLPGDWVDAHRQMRLVLRAGNKVLWQDLQLPRSTPMTINNRRYLLTATQVGEQLRLDLAEARTGLSPSAN